MNHQVNQERVFVALDVMNLYHSGQEQFGRDYRVNFGKLVEMIRGKRICRLPRNLHTIAYTVTPHFQISKNGSMKQIEPHNKGFMTYLEKIGIEIKNRETYIEKSLNKLMATDWDVGITLDALKYIDSYDTFSLASGDGDYSLLLDELKERGKYTEIITFGHSASRILCATAHRTLFITEEEMFQRSQRNGKNYKNASQDQTSSS